MHNITYINYASLDVEGSELEILDIFDPKKTPVEIWSIEVTYPETQIRLINIMKSKGYILYTKLNYDWIFIDKTRWNLKLKSELHKLPRIITGREINIK